MHLRIEIEGDEYDMWIARDGNIVKIEVDGQTYETRVNEQGTVTLDKESHPVTLDGDNITIGGHTLPYRILDYAAGGAPGDHRTGSPRGARIKPPMPGKIVSISVQEGQEVKQGQILLILEAMKMQNEIAAPTNGTIKKIHIKPGQNVEGKDLLIEIE